MVKSNVARMKPILHVILQYYRNYWELKIDFSIFSVKGESFRYLRILFGIFSDQILFQFVRKPTANVSQYYSRLIYLAKKKTALIKVKSFKTTRLRRYLNSYYYYYYKLEQKYILFISAGLCNARKKKEIIFFFIYLMCITLRGKAIFRRLFAI